MCTIVYMCMSVSIFITNREKTEKKSKTNQSKKTKQEQQREKTSNNNAEVGNSGHHFRHRKVLWVVLPITHLFWAALGHIQTLARLPIAPSRVSSKDWALRRSWLCRGRKVFLSVFRVQWTSPRPALQPPQEHYSLLQKSWLSKRCCLISGTLVGWFNET